MLAPMRRSVLLIALACAIAPVSGASETIEGRARIIDGDTLEIGETKIRLNGIDAPEHGQKCESWTCGSAATDRLAALAEGAALRCEAGSLDGYGRTIATCWAGSIDIGAVMVSEGLAWAFVRYSDAYVSQEAEAKAAGRGVWRYASIPPWEYRAARWASAETTAPEGCPIKGNISKSGRIYHAPWSPWYSRTRINTAKGERWFCSEAEAVAAGWRAPHWR